MDKLDLSEVANIQDAEYQLSKMKQVYARKSKVSVNLLILRTNNSRRYSDEIAKFAREKSILYLKFYIEHLILKSDLPQKIADNSRPKQTQPVLTLKYESFLVCRLASAVLHH